MRAVELRKNNPIFLNTLGLAYEFAARSAENPLRQQALLSEAERLFDSGSRREPGDPYGYIGKVNVLRQKIEREQDSNRRAMVEANALSLLEEAYEVTEGNHIIATQLGIQRNRLGDPANAIAILTTALKEKPTDNRIHDILVKLLTEKSELDKALEIASEGVLLDPTSWRLQRHVARLMRQLKLPLQAVKGHYETAVRHRKVDVSLLVELGAYLFINGLYSDAGEVFFEARRLPVNGYEKRSVRDWWRNEDGEKSLFSGKVKYIRGASAYVLAIPENFEAFFWRIRGKLVDLNEGDEVKFYVGFNAYGPLAELVVAK